MPTMYSVLYGEYIYMYINPFMERGEESTHANSLGNRKPCHVRKFEERLFLDKKKKKIIESHR